MRSKFVSYALMTLALLAGTSGAQLEEEPAAAPDPVEASPGLEQGADETEPATVPAAPESADSGSSSPGQEAPLRPPGERTPDLERFDPSEAISEDRSVSFPNDI